MGRQTAAAIGLADYRHFQELSFQNLYNRHHAFDQISSSNAMAGSLIVRDPGNNTYCFDATGAYSSSMDQHAEAELLHHLGKKYNPRSRLPNNSKVLIHTYWSPCRRCYEAYRLALWDGSDKINWDAPSLAGYPRSWIRDTVNTVFKITWKHNYIGKSTNQWKSQSEMQSAYDALTQATGGRVTFKQVA